jgi:hypothetical protein
VGSNPTLSAKEFRIADCEIKTSFDSHWWNRFEMALNEIRNSQSAIHNSWRGAGVAELAALEMLCMGNRNVGSNPNLSAKKISDCGFRIAKFWDGELRSLIGKPAIGNRQ